VKTLSRLKLLFLLFLCDSVAVKLQQDVPCALRSSLLVSHVGCTRLQIDQDYHHTMNVQNAHQTVWILRRSLLTGSEKP